MVKCEKELRDEIAHLVKEFYDVKFKAIPFQSGKSPVRYAGRVFDEKELQTLIDASLDFWLTSGRYSEEFEASFSAFTGTEYCFLVNSGSSANLLAVTALMSPLLGNRRLKPDDEIISVAAGFPSTINPIIQNGMVPVFVDDETGCQNQIKRSRGHKLNSIARLLAISQTCVTLLPQTDR